MADWPRLVEIFAGRRSTTTRSRRSAGYDATQTVVRKISDTTEILDSRIRFLYAKIQEGKQTVRANLAKGDRQLALSNLRMVKGHEKAREVVIRRKDSVSAMRAVIEESKFNKIALDAIKTTHQFIKEAKMPKVEEVDQMIDDIVCARDEVNEMLMEASTALEPVYDEDELGRELDELLELSPPPPSETKVVSRGRPPTASAAVAAEAEDPSPSRRDDGEELLLLD